jgi:hypothetical protein
MRMSISRGGTGEGGALNGRSPVFLKPDLADLKSVGAAAEAFVRKLQGLHILIELVTNDGHEDLGLTYLVNVIVLV